MIELCCGWGCWMNITGAAARRAGKSPFLIGVEGDEGHIAFAHEAMATNGFAPSQFQLVRGVAAAKAGSAFFPRQSRSGVAWGLEPVLDADETQMRRMRASGGYDELKKFALRDVIGERKRIDLLYVDIQGGEMAAGGAAHEGAGDFCFHHANLYPEQPEPSRCRAIREIETPERA